MGAGCVTDATDIKIRDGQLVIDRYSFGGSTVASIVVKTAQQVISVMPRTFELAPKTATQGKIITFVPEVKAPRVNVIERQEKQGEATPIEEAETLVCIGRGVADRKDLPMIEALAKSLKAEIGCTRPLTHEWSWFPESREVGLSGKKCKPALCLSLGISGQIQHTVGIRTSKIIAVINKDKNAPIFKTADYGIVADLYEVAPLLTQKILSLSAK
jgi:electron transfer flavoprotein alpha subunit